MREEQIWEIDGIDLFEKTDFWLRKFPTYCVDGPKPTRADGICELMVPRKYYHIAATFGPNRAELWIDGVQVAGMQLDVRISMSSNKYHTMPFGSRKECCRISPLEFPCETSQA